MRVVNIADFNYVIQVPGESPYNLTLEAGKTYEVPSEYENTPQFAGLVQRKWLGKATLPKLQNEASPEPETATFEEPPQVNQRKRRVRHRKDPAAGTSEFTENASEV